ncbi:MAG: ribonuclease H, partial [Fimbriimonadaceae bacterium]
RSSEAATIVQVDGCCLGRTGPGGWAVLINERGASSPVWQERSGHVEQPTTNQRMELIAAIEGLRPAAHPSTGLIVRSDSQYLVLGMRDYLGNWVGNDWRRADGKPVKNRDLWEQLSALSSRHPPVWHWIAGRSQDVIRDRAHQVAVAAALASLR